MIPYRTIWCYTELYDAISNYITWYRIEIYGTISDYIAPLRTQWCPIPHLDTKPYDLKYDIYYIGHYTKLYGGTVEYRSIWHHTKLYGILYRTIYFFSIISISRILLTALTGNLGPGCIQSPLLIKKAVSNAGCFDG